jgi:hypothetical protein
VTVRRPSLLAWTLAAFMMGAGLLLVFDHAVTLALGVLLLFAFIVLGVFTIAEPGYLARTPDDPEE